MDLVASLNQIFPSSSSFEERYEEAVEYTKRCRAYLAAQLAHRPDVFAENAAAMNLPHELSQLTAETRKIQEIGISTLKTVQRVTSEIKRLDAIKENLTCSIRMLRQLKMLTKLYLQLDMLLKEKRYEDMAGSVKAASDLIDYFRPFRPLPQISQLSQEIGKMEAKIYSQVQESFGIALETNGSAEELRAACVVLDSLDSAVGEPFNRERLIKWYCETMLAEYRHIFNRQDEAGTLDNVTRRFTYLKNKVLLRYLASHTQFFPEEWPVKPRLVSMAQTVTADDLMPQVSALRASDGDQVQKLLATIQESADFEAYTKVKPAVITPRLMPFMSLWVDFQDRQLQQRIQTYARMLVPPDAANEEVIPSSKDLVSFYRALLAQLSKLKSQERKTVLQLADVMANHLGRYAARVLIAYLPSGALRGPEDVASARVIEATAEYIMVTTQQLVRNLSSILLDTLTANSTNSATSTTTAANGNGSVSGTNSIGSTNGSTTENESDVIDEIFETKALGSLRQVGFRIEDLTVAYIERSLEPRWVEFAHQYTAASRNGKLDVSRVSPYTATMVQHIQGLLRSIFEQASSPGIIYGVGTRTTDSVCTGFLTMAMARVAKPLGESLVEQMLLDLGTIKTQALVGMLNCVPSETKVKKGSQRLERLGPRMLESIAQAEAVLKVLMTPVEPMETFVCNYQVLVKDRSTLNFRKILDVKGIRFQPRAVEKFKLMASQDPHLIAENTLLKSIPTVAAQPASFDANANTFGFRRFGDFLRRDRE